MHKLLVQIADANRTRDTKERVLLCGKWTSPITSEGNEDGNEEGVLKTMVKVEVQEK